MLDKTNKAMTINNNDRKYIYIIISQTGSVLSRILKRITGAEYNHVSISLTSNLHRMYSFGRRHPYNPFWGGFVIESPRAGTFKRFENTRAVVLALPVSSETYFAMDKKIHAMLSEKNTYHYNLCGLVLAALHIQYKKERYYYCSEFVKEMLTQFDVDGAERLMPIAQPIHFMNFPSSHVVYSGKLSEYNKVSVCKRRATA